MDKAIDYLIIIGKSVAVYLFIIAAIRIFGKKELAQLSVVDLVFILLISNSVQNAMVGTDSTLPGGLVAALGLFVANYILKLLFRTSPWFSRAVQGEKIILIQDGVVLQKGMREALMTMPELEMAIREHGVDAIREVDLAVLEVDGNISVLSENYKHRTIKRRKKPQLSHNP
ncbi:MAG: YetF domain-containing protein [Ferruginibacter sp.]